VKTIVIPEYEHLICFRGKQEEFEGINWDVLTQNFGERVERILFSSTQHASGDVFAVVCPGRHFHNIRAMHVSNEANLGPTIKPGQNNVGEQGFLTNFGRWVSREEAFLIAQKAGQIIKKSDYPSSVTLYSECIWETPALYHWGYGKNPEALPCVPDRPPLRVSNEDFTAPLPDKSKLMKDL
jgi:hypothetical protein